MASAFVQSPRPFGRAAGGAPCVPLRALFASPEWRPWPEEVECQPAWTGSTHPARPCSSQGCTEAAGALRAGGTQQRTPQETWRCFRAMSALHWYGETRFAGKELTALYTPCSNNSLLQLPGWGDSKGTWHRRPQGRALLHHSPGGHKHVRLPCEEAKVAYAESLIFWVTHLLHSLSLLKH